MTGLATGTVYFASDVHWRPAGAGDAEPTGLFGRFLADLAARARESDGLELYVLGDLFDFWFEQGGKTFEFYAPHLDALARAREAGLAITVLDGNRDFTYGPLLPERCGVELAGDRAALRRDGVDVQLQHGDLLCIGDKRYQIYRRFVRSAPVRQATRVVTLSQVERLVGWMRRASEAEIARKAPTTLAIADAAVVRELERGFDVVVCGHVHRAERRSLVTEVGSGELVVLGSWGRTHGSYAVLRGGRIELEDYAA